MQSPSRWAWSDLGYANPVGAMRRIVGELAVDRLEASEQWRAATTLRRSIELLWPVDESSAQ